MTCQHCVGAEDVFGDGTAERDLKAYRKQGAAQTTRWLIAALQQQGVEGLSLLDIGGGIGTIPLGLLPNGLQSALGIDASQAYLQAAHKEAQANGYEEQVSYLHGDFVDLADDIAPVDIVTLDRVVCCYPHMEALVRLSVARAKQYYALVYPRDNFLTRVGVVALNLGLRLRGNPFRTFVHRSREVDGLVRAAGFVPILQHKTWFWQTVVYRREV